MGGIQWGSFFLLMRSNKTHKLIFRGLILVREKSWSKLAVRRFLNHLHDSLFKKWRMKNVMTMPNGVWRIPLCPFKKFYIIMMIDKKRHIQLYNIGINTVVGSLYTKIVYLNNSLCLQKYFIWEGNMAFKACKHGVEYGRSRTRVDTLPKKNLHYEILENLLDGYLSVMRTLEECILWWY